MASASIWVRVTAPGLSPLPQDIGSIARPFTLASITLAHTQQFNVATGTTKILLNVGAGATDDIADFDLLYLYSTQDLSIELIGSVTANNSNFKIKALIPFLLPFSKTRVYNAAGGFAGTLEDITKISCKNESGLTADITLAAFT